MNWRGVLLCLMDPLPCGSFSRELDTIFFPCSECSFSRELVTALVCDALDGWCSRKLNQDNVYLGTACGKFHRVSCLSIFDPVNGALVYQLMVWNGMGIPKPTAVAAFNFTRKLFVSTISHPLTETLPLTKPDLQSLVLSNYQNGKFRDLLSNVVASPTLLLTASDNLTKHVTTSSRLTIDSVSTLFSLQDLSLQLRNNSFDVESCCIAKGKSLVLPNLKLKVVLESIRIVLEVIYDDRFVTFSYGGRPNLGRHTAIRYLKNYVQSPTWWFGVHFDVELFEIRHVDKLCTVLGEKIEDDALVNLIKRLFKLGVLKIELGGICLGRGLPQECGLSSILLNIYFHRFDKEIQELRLETNNENPKFKTDELISVQSKSENVFHKPPKIYAVRYLDEILIITSGTKMFTMNLKTRVVKFLERNLDFKVNKLRTVIHSPVSEKIEFMGMEIQAVAPSILHRQPTEKAIRARKKYERQKEVRLLELKNAKERNRKVLGLKLLKHVFKKLKQSNGFKFDFQIEKEVRQIFSTWGDETVKEYLKSVDDRWEWHRKLTAGHFLSLERIRDQLPKGLIDAHDNFQHQVDKYLNPVKAKRAMEEDARKAEEMEEKRYAERTIEDLTKRCIKVDAPLELIRKAIRMVGFTNKMGRPRPISLLTLLEDADIIKWYAGVGKRLLDFYCCCHNFRNVKIIVSYHLRFSCILTLSEKHEATKNETIRHFTKDLKVSEVYFPSEREVKMMGDRNLSDPMPVDGALTLALTRLATDESSNRCIAHFCDKTDITTYRVQLLQKHLIVNPLDENSWVHGMGSIPDCLHRNCASLCYFHASEFYMGRLTFQDIDCSSLVDVS